MGLVPFPLPCHTKESTEESLTSSSTTSGLHSVSSTSSSLSSQPSLPSVLSLTPSKSNQLEVLGSPSVHHHCIATLQSQSYICTLALSGNFLYSGSSDGRITAWSSILSHPSNPRYNKVVATPSTVKSLVVVGSGDDRNKLLFSAHQDHKIRVWKINTTDTHEKLKCIATLPTLNDRATRFFFPKNYVQIRRHKKYTWVHHVDTVSALAISNDGSFLYSVSWDRTLKIWRTSDFKCLESVSNAHDDAINAVTFSRDGTFVYTGSADKKIKVWTWKKDKSMSVRLVGTLEKHKSAVNALAFNTDGSVLYSGACDRSILVWERDGGADGGGGHMVVVGALRGHTKAVLCLSVVADLVCSGSADYSVRVWRRLSSGLVGDYRNRSYCCLAVLEGHRRPVKCLTAAVDNTDSDYSGDSYFVYSGSLDCYIKVWQIRVPFS
ncbi:protein JINGUBANG [Pyrus x bretschneideri]|uniref:protein JINGUBANG n=1 Tax=Pyrus x bretschneideri TaxID=225117 RepID=UPI00202F87D2|nr:protein JINGUBANG [Pyrus x bretschneideri]